MSWKSVDEAVREINSMREEIMWDAVLQGMDVAFSPLEGDPTKPDVFSYRHVLIAPDDPTNFVGWIRYRTSEGAAMIGGTIQAIAVALGRQGNAAGGQSRKSADGAPRPVG